ncbi:MFS transporter, partial [Escherichia coli]|nr:MFS transporter [Escherichia coli]
TRLTLAWWQYLAVALAPLVVFAWAFGGMQPLIPILAMPMFIAGVASMFLTLPRFNVYKHALIATGKALDSEAEPAAWIELARVRRLGMLFACL